MSQLHKRFTLEELKELLECYLKKEIERTCIQGSLDIKKRRFFMLLKQYKENPQDFTVQDQRTSVPGSISPEIEQNILRELAIEKEIIPCLRMNRTIDPYRRISIHNLQLKVNHATPRKEVNLRIYPLNNQISEIRFWCEGKLIDIQRVKNSDLKGVHF